MTLNLNQHASGPSSRHSLFGASRVATRLHVGSYDAVEAIERYNPGFTMLVLCAEELQPRFDGRKIKIVRPAFNDTPYPRPTELDRARRAAMEVAREWKQGGRILVTCAAGLNRSSFVAALAIKVLRPGTATEDIVQAIRAARGEHALQNPAFLSALLHS